VSKKINGKLTEEKLTKSGYYARLQVGEVTGCYSSLANLGYAILATFQA